MPRKVLATLDLNGPLFLTGAVGTSGQVLTSAGPGATPTWTTSTNINNPLLTRIDSTNEGGQINFARASDGSAYWYIDSFGSTASPDLRFIENATERFKIAAGGVIYVNGSAGTSGQVLTSSGTGSAPTWTTVSGGSFTGGTLTSSLTLRSSGGTGAGTAPLYFGIAGTNSLLATPIPGAFEYDNIAHYLTPENNSGTATAGRALVATPHHYITTLTGLDFSTSSAAQTLLTDGATNTTRGITVLAGTSYEFEMYFAVQYQSFGDTTTQLNFGWTRTTVSGTPTTTINAFLDYGNNTTAFTTAVTLSSIVGSATTTVAFTSPGASGSRYIVYRGRGIIRVTGSGSVKIYPNITPTATTANTPTVQGNGYFKLMPVGNGTSTSVGAFN